VSETLWGALAIGFIGTTFWFARTPAPSIAGDIAVKTETHFHGWRGENDADGTLRIFDDKDRVVSAFHLRDNRVSEVPVERNPDEPAYTARFDRDYYLGQHDLDLGVWTGYSKLDNLQHWQTGVRYSPVRVLYDSISADAVISQDAAGTGISLFPPADSLGDFWRHTGIGVWYMAPFDGGSPGLVFGFSFSTH
jgi:hypothetical protein